MRHIGTPRPLGNSTIFMVCVIIALCWLAFRGCALPPITAEQRLAQKVEIAEQQARNEEARATRQQRAPFDLAVYILVRLAALALFVAAGAGLISTLTLRGWGWAASLKPVGGLFPLVISKVGGAWTVFDANRAVGATTQLGNGGVLVTPGWEQAQVLLSAGAQHVQAVQAQSYNVQVNQAQAALAPAGETAPVTMNWPGHVPLVRYMDALGCNLDNIFLGITCDTQTGQQKPVTLGMNDLVHFAVAGSSGFGKTTFLESLLYQFVRSGACDLALVDLKSELVAWRNADALRWPVATTRQDGGAILTACYDELQIRKDAFESIGGAKSLADYNARANGAGQFRPLVAVLDEGTVLLRGDKELSDQAVDLVLLGRSFGLWLVLAAQDFKVSSTASEIRNQLTTRVQFHAQDATQARILLGHDKAQGLSVGRAICRLKGAEQDLELQAPVVSRAEIDALLSGQRGPSQGAPVIVDVAPEQAPNSLTDEQKARIIELADEGETVTSIVKTIWGSKNGRRLRQVRAILDSGDAVTG